MHYQCDNLHLALQERAKNRTRRQLALDLGLPESKHAIITKMLNGKPVSRASEIEIGRALGVLPPARTIPRVTPNKAQRERRAALGVSWHEVIEKGLRSLEARGHD